MKELKLDYRRVRSFGFAQTSGDSQKFFDKRLLVKFITQKIAVQHLDSLAKISGFLIGANAVAVQKHELFSERLKVDLFAGVLRQQFTNLSV